MFLMTSYIFHCSIIPKDDINNAIKKDFTCYVELNISGDTKFSCSKDKEEISFHYIAGMEEYSLIIEREIILQLHKNSSELIKFCLI